MRPTPEGLEGDEPETFLGTRVDHDRRTVVDPGDAVFPRPVELDPPPENVVRARVRFELIGIPDWTPDEMEVVRHTACESLKRFQGRHRLFDPSVNAHLKEERAFGGLHR